MVYFGRVIEFIEIEKIKLKCYFNRIIDGM